MNKPFVMDVNDQSNLSFAFEQTTHVETQVIEKKYPNIRYAEHVPIDTSANPFAKSVTFMSQDKVGAAKFINGHGDDVPLANVNRQKFETEVFMAAIGYSFSLEEIGQGMMMGQNLDADGAMAARTSYEQFMDQVAYLGNAQTGMQGLLNSTGVATAPAAGLWSALTPDQVLAEINEMISSVWSASLGIELCNTVLLPIDVIADISTRRLGDTDMTILDFIKKANVYTAQTSQQLEISGTHRLTTSAMAYNNSPDAVKMHLPMALQFLPLQPRNLEYVVPGMFRTGGVDFRRPGSAVYRSGVA